MKKISIVITVLALIWFSCTKASFVPTEVDCGTDVVTYNNQMQDIIDTKCASGECHNGTPGVPGIYTSYDGMKGAFEGKMSKRVIDDQNTALSMPTPESDTLTSEEFVLFSCWIQQEFPEN